MAPMFKMPLRCPAHVPRIARCLLVHVYYHKATRSVMSCRGVLQFPSTQYFMTANSFCVFFLLKLPRTVRWGKNSGTRTRMILREMGVSIGTQTYCRWSLLYTLRYPRHDTLLLSPILPYSLFSW